MNTTHFPPTPPPPPLNPLRSSDKGQKLQEAWEQQQFLRAVEDIEDWIGDMESQMASEDLGRDLISVNNLIKKHAVRQSICRLSLSFVCLFVYLSLGLSLFSVCLVCLPVRPYPSFNSMKTHIPFTYIHHLPVYFLTHTSTPSLTPCSLPLYSCWKMISRLNRAGLMTSWLRCGGSVKPTTSRVTRLKTGAESLWQSETFKI